MNELLAELVEHNYWATRRVLATAATLPEAAWLAQGWHGMQDGLRATLVHVLDAERGWRHRLRSAAHSWGDDLLEASFPTPGSLAAAWDADEREMRAWIATLDDEELRTPLNLNQWNQFPLWYDLAHELMHSQQHRSEVALMLTELGHSPGDLDFLDYAEGLAKG